MDNIEKSMQLLHDLSKQWHPASPTFQAINDGISALKTLSDMEQNSIAYNVSRETFLSFITKLEFYNCSGVSCTTCPYKLNNKCLSAFVCENYSILKNLYTVYEKENQL